MTQRPRIFIGAASESQDIAEALQSRLYREFDVKLWDQNFFDASKYNLEALVSRLENFDFAIFVFAPVDQGTIRGKTVELVRDNVLFEAGLFLARLGRERCFFVAPMERDPHLPSDLAGYNLIRYSEEHARTDPEAALGAACTVIRQQIRLLSSRKPDSVATVYESVGTSPTQFLTLLGEAREEIITVGPSLTYIANHCRNAVFGRARRGVRCRFLMALPDGYEWLKDYGSGNPNRTGEYQLVVENFRDWLKEAAKEALPIEVRVAPLVPTSMNFVDGEAEDGKMLLIPLPYQTDGPERPCFLMEKRANTDAFKRYYEQIVALFDQSTHLQDIPVDEMVRDSL
jgi:Predicted nucleotide-binding protein containing TIR-like domain